MNAPTGKARVLTNPSKVADFWDWLTHRPQGYVACDIESGSDPAGSELDIFKPGFHVRMMQFGDADGGWAIPFQEWKGLVRGAFDWISESRTQHVWHNGFGFDAQALRQEGIIIDPSIMQDTQIWAGLGGFAGESRGLKQLARKELGDFGAKTAIGADRLHNGMKQAGWTWTTVPMGWKPYPLYGVMDTMATARLYEKWEPWRKQFAYHHDMEIAVSVITNQMARTGMVVDGEYIAIKVDELMEEEAELEAQCNAAGWGNPSNRADALRVLKAAGVLDETRLTDGGQVSIDKKQLRNVDHPLARLRLQYMKVQRMRKDYLEKLLHMIGGEMSPQVIHPSIWSMAAKTGRMSVSNPPLQQLPAGDTTARRAFLPDNPDHVLIGADFGQIEMRAWAILNNDPILKQMFNQADETGDDFFVLMGRDLYGEPDFQKSDPRRSPIKNTSYATIFAGGIKTISETANLPESQVEPVLNALKKRYPSFKDQGASMVHKKDGAYEIWTPNGRRFKVRDPKDARVLPNWATQGWAATILKESALGCKAAGLGDNLRLAVHDELILSVPRREAKDAAHEMEEIMNAQIDPEEHGVRIYAKANIGSSWAELK
jgi:DNA polymerase-1